MWSFAVAIVATAFGVSSASGQTVYYWDANGATAGFGTASGTWGGSSFFSTNASGTIATTSVTTTLSNDLNFGTGSAGLTTGTVEVSGSQSIRSLVFGSQSGVLTLTGGTIGLAASGTITANQASNTNTINSILAGAATGLVKNGAGTAILSAANTYSGSTSVTAGTLTLGGANGSILSSGVIGVTGATFTLDNATSNNNDRLGSTAAVTLNAASTFIFNGNGATASTTEAFGNLGFGGGQSTVTLGGAGAAQLQTLAAASVSRAAGAVGLVRGTSLQTAATNATRLTIGGTAGTGLVFVGSGTSALGVSTAGTDKSLRIVPYLVGDTSATGNGSSFLTYDVDATAFGLRPLAAGEYTTLAAGYSTPAAAENVNAFNGTITTANPTVNSLRFNAANQTLNGSGSLTIDSGAIFANASTTAIGSGFSSLSLGNGSWNEGVIFVASGNTFTVNAPIAVTGGGGLTKGFSGTLALNAANTYSGDTVVNAGNLTLGASGLLGGGNYAGILRAVRTATLTLTNTASQTFAGGLSSGGLLTLNAPGAVSISGGLTTSAGVTVGANASAVQISGSWTNGGNINVPTGKTLAYGNGSLTSPVISSISGGGTVEFTSGTAMFGFAPVGSSAALRVDGGARVQQSGGVVNSFGGQGLWLGFNGSGNGSYTITGGTLALSGTQAGGAPSVILGYVNAANVTVGGTLTIDGDSALVTVGSLGNSPIGWSWTGGSNSVSNGTLNLARGELQFGSTSIGGGGVTNNALFNFGGPAGVATMRPIAGGGLSLSSGLAFVLQGSNGVINSTDSGGTARTVTMSSVITETGGRRNLEFAGAGTTSLAAANTFSGTALLTGGTLALANRNALQNSTLNVGSTVTFTVAGTGTYAFGGLAGSTGLAIGGNTLRIGSNNDSTTYGGVVSGASGGLAKVGAGTLTLTAVQEFTGATRISDGRLEIGSAGAINTSSGIAIDGGDLRFNAATALTKPITFTAGMISGTGTIGTAVTVATGNVISPGNSPGTQAYTSLHAWAPGGTYQWELNALTGAAGTTWDLVNVTSGTFDLSALAVSPGNQFVLDLTTLDALNAAGPLATPYDGGSYTFAIASYNPAHFLLPSGFTNTPGIDLTSLFDFDGLANWQGPKPEVGNISVKINAAANGIDLVIVPEPATLVLLAAGGAAAFVRARRRRSCGAVRF